ncbi:hypothetical protein [Spirosoma sp. KNUC1025]|uniref:hypothetical protein n=1 Tax=Spirosoma sp. KNUC1025 TaxID=2894082 RepID=UPI00386E5E21|nr:hypothetical protein LN737_02685 [Spirosoma sp. KNUC1025]
MLVCFLLASWSSFAGQTNHTRLTFLSGKDMFKGVFFLEGQYAQMLPETQSLKTAFLNQNLSGQQRTAVAQVRESLLASIESAHPGYFAQFKSALKSGDAVRVSQALAEGEGLVAQALDKLYQLDKAQLGKLQAQAQGLAAGQGGKLDAQAMEKLVSQLQKGEMREAGVGACAVIAVVVLAVCVAAVLVVVAVGVAEELSADNHKPGSHSLYQEQLVASICQTAPLIA